jgi:hypothetical protein
MSDPQRVKVVNPEQCKGPGDGCSINVMVGIIIGLLITISSTLAEIGNTLHEIKAQQKTKVEAER